MKRNGKGFDAADVKDLGGDVIEQLADRAVDVVEVSAAVKAPRSKPTQKAAPSPLPRVVTAAELDATTFAPTRWTVPDILPEGTGLLTAPSKMGKSFLALNIAYSVATGGVALGTKPVGPARSVLYLDLDRGSEKRTQARLRKIAQGASLPGNLCFAYSWRQLGNGEDDLIAWLQSHQDTGLVVIDILQNIRPTRSRNGNVYSEDYEAFAPLRSVVDQCPGITILVLHHTRKNVGGDHVDRVSGSMGLTGGADTLIELRRERGRADAILSVTGRDIEQETELALNWDGLTGQWVLMGDAIDYTRTLERQAVITLFKSYPKDREFSPSEVADLLDKPGGGIRKLLAQMAKDADGIVSPSRGKYKLSPYTPKTTY
jgi:hypothetical protein